ncbi:MAG: hypothetical protein IT291_03105 [Deltaproteobacteria bacterium]|nr:hypothetical protein [Deltaproteobacteria bacterium]
MSYFKRTNSCWALLLIFGLAGFGMSSIGCASMSFGGMDNLVLGDAQDLKELGERVTKFYEALYWQDAELAAVYVVPRQRGDFQRRAKELRAKEKLTEADVQGIEVNRESGEAKVSVHVRYYQVPSYLLKTRKEEQIWEFSAAEGEWLLREVGIVVEES